MVVEKQNRITPKSEGDLAAFLKDCTEPVNIEGGGTRPVGNVAPATVLSTRNLAGIRTYEPGALTLVAGAGTLLSDVEAALAAENQRLPFEPINYNRLLGTTGAPTLGGIVASNSSGPRRIQVGAARDFTLGVNFVDGAGTILKNGGRVMKNVTGYDLVKLMAGSWGTLGVLTEVSLKVLPIAETTGTLALAMKDDVAAVKVMSAALGSPFDVTGAASIGQHAYIRVEGFDASVAYRLGELTQLLGPMSEGCEVLKSNQIWEDIRDVGPFDGKAGDVWRISVKPTDGPVVARLLGGDAFFDWSGGLVWACLPTGTDVRGKLTGISGHATRVRGNGPQAFAPQNPAVATLSKGIKDKFDPKGILNVGRMG